MCALRISTYIPVHSEKRLAIVYFEFLFLCQALTFSSYTLEKIVGKCESYIEKNVTKRRLLNNHCGFFAPHTFFSYVNIFSAKDKQWLWRHTMRRISAAAAAAAAEDKGSCSSWIYATVGGDEACPRQNRRCPTKYLGKISKRRQMSLCVLVRVLEQ